MVRECRPRERGLSSLKLARRSTMTTSVPANVSSAASIIPVGPPPATTTACSVIRHPHPRRFWFRSEILQHDPGLAASPPVRYTLRTAGSTKMPKPARGLISAKNFTSSRSGEARIKSSRLPLRAGGEPRAGKAREFKVDRLYDAVDRIVFGIDRREPQYFVALRLELDLPALVQLEPRLVVT